MRIDQIPDPVQRERQLDYNRAIAQKIRNRLQQLENANEKDKRRWIWELLQNAKDTVSDRKVDIEIITNEKYIEFRHNGGYFSPRNITNLIHQISSKEGIEGNIGRFGTGFLTTHTLSRLVEVEGVFSENNEFYKFELNLDRQSSTEIELVEGIEKSWESFQSKKIEKPNNETWTVFRYLNPDKEVANDTLKDFETFIHFNLAFVQGLGKVTINKQIEKSKTTFELLHEPKEIEEGISIFSFLKGKEQIDLLLAENENVSIAIEVKKTENSYSFKPILENIPRVFCAFPLIGTEEFYFPFVVNSNQFIPKTERDRLYLRGETKDADNNKEILAHAVDLYKKVVKLASENKWKDFYVIADTKLPKEDDDFDRNWYKDNIQKTIRQFLLTLPIVETEKDGLIPILDEEEKANTYFPFNSNTEIRKEIWKYTFDLYPNNIPCKKHIDSWYKIIWNKAYHQTLEVLAEDDIQNSENIESLSESLKKDIENTYEWTNQICLFFEKEKPELFEEFKVLPNQYGVFKLKKDLYEDKNIPDELKEINKQLGADWKDDLLHKSIKIEMSSYRTVYAISETIDSVIRNNEFDFSDNDFNNTIYQLIAYTNKEQAEKQKKIWEFSRAFYYEEIPEKILVLENTEKFDWSESLEWQINKLAVDISELKYVETLGEELHGAINTIDWLKDFINFIQEDEYKYLLDSEENPILPNQNGWFYPKSQLFLDDGTLDSELKEALRPINSEWLDELLDINIYLDLPSNRERSFEDIANQIDITFKNFPTADRELQEFKKAFENLYAWFQEQDENKLKKYFEWTYRNMTMLYVSSIGTVEEQKSVLAIASSGKSHIFSNIANNKEIDNDDLEFFANNPKKIKQLREMEESGKSSVSKQAVLDEKLEEINTKLGKNFNSLDEFVSEFIAKDKKIDFMDEPTGNSKYVDMKAIKTSNENARQAIFDYLDKHTDYDVTEWTKITNTIISKIKKNGININVITKGANNGIIYFNDKEKDILKNEKSFSELGFIVAVSFLKSILVK